MTKDRFLLRDSSFLQGTTSEADQLQLLLDEFIHRRFLDTIIDNVSRIDAVEMHALYKFIDYDGEETLESEPGGDFGPPFCYGVFVHFKDGGIDVCGEFTLYASALIYALEIANKYGWKLYNYAEKVKPDDDKVRYTNGLLQMAISLKSSYEQSIFELDPSLPSELELQELAYELYISGLRTIWRKLFSLHD